MCESFSPGMTVRPPTSITDDDGPRSRRISSLPPRAWIAPFAMATASTNAGCAFVANRPLWRIRSGTTPPCAARAPRGPVPTTLAAAAPTAAASSSRRLSVPMASALRLRRHLLRLPVALDERLIVGRHHRVELRELGGDGLVPRSVHLAQHGVRGRGDDARLPEARQRGPRRHLARVA